MDQPSTSSAAAAASAASRRRSASSPLPLLPEHSSRPRLVLPTPTFIEIASSSLVAGCSSQQQQFDSGLTDEDLKIFAQFADEPMEYEDRDLIIMINCSICNVTKDLDRDAYHLSCGHEYCKICLIDVIENKFTPHGQVLCPNERCHHQLDDIELNIILGERYKDFNDRRDELLAETLASENEAFIVNKSEFECKICLCATAPGDGVTIKSCHHSFCLDCLTGYIRNSEDVDIKCPFNDGTVNCGENLTEREMKAFLPDEVFSKHVQKSLTLFEATSSKTHHCFKADCAGFVELVDKNNVQRFTCQVCNEVNCIQCGAIHMGKTCDEYQDAVNPDRKQQRKKAQDEEAFKAYVAEGKAMKCPQCETAIVKDGGCDFLQCPTCKLGICWVTKKPRMPLVKSDGVVIDGCHCKEKGRRCHPRCCNCH